MSVKRANERDKEGAGAKWLLLTCTLVAKVALALVCAVTLSLGGYTVALTFFILATFFNMLTQVSSTQATPPVIFLWACWSTAHRVRGGQRGGPPVGAGRAARELEPPASGLCRVRGQHLCAQRARVFCVSLNSLRSLPEFEQPA